MTDQEFSQVVRSAARRPEVVESIRSLYASVQNEIDQRRPACSISGRCCRFEEYGHRLYVTTLELAAFVAGNPPTSGDWDGTGCPFQKSRLCGVHPIRPFGCRIYFCDPTSTDWQNAAYERFHARLKRMHVELEVPYRYVEWRTALDELGLAAKTR